MMDEMPLGMMREWAAAMAIEAEEQERAIEDAKAGKKRPARKVNVDPEFAMWHMDRWANSIKWPGQRRAKA